MGSVFHSGHIQRVVTTLVCPPSSGLARLRILQLPMVVGASIHGFPERLNLVHLLEQSDRLFPPSLLSPCFHSEVILHMLFSVLCSYQLSSAPCSCHSACSSSKLITPSGRYPRDQLPLADVSSSTHSTPIPCATSRFFHRLGLLNQRQPEAANVQPAPSFFLSHGHHIFRTVFPHKC